MRINVVEEIKDVAQLDFRREFRAGIPEIVLAEGKTPSDTVKMVLKLLELKGSVVVTRVSKEHINALKEAVMDEHEVQVNEKARLIVVRKKSFKIKKIGRKIGIMTGGTSDIPVARKLKL